MTSSTFWPEVKIEEDLGWVPSMSFEKDLKGAGDSSLGNGARAEIPIAGEYREHYREYYRKACTTDVSMRETRGRKR